MDKQKIVIILLVVSIILSGVSTIIAYNGFSNLNSDGLESACNPDNIVCEGNPTYDGSGQVSFQIVSPPGASS